MQKKSVYMSVTGRPEFSDRSERPEVSSGRHEFRFTHSLVNTCRVSYYILYGEALARGFYVLKLLLLRMKITLVSCCEICDDYEYINDFNDHEDNT